MKLKVHTIYALIRGETAYIGKTAGKRVSAVYSAHICGEKLATRADFAKPKPAPDLHILHRSEMLAFEAYKHTLAYIHFFNNAGYKILNSPRSIQRAYNLKEDTQRIFDGINSRSISELLELTSVNNVTEADIKPKKAHKEDEKKNADCQITIRLSQKEKAYFQKLGNKLHFNQHQTLLYLFDKCEQTDPVFLDLEGDSYLRVLFDAYREEIQKLNKANETLHDKLVASREDKNKKIAALNESLANIKTSVRAYFDLMENAMPIPLEIEYGLYHETAEAEKYKYPQTAGVYLIRPQMVLRGKGRYSAMFIMCYGENGEYLKFRYYPKKNYIGVPIPDSQFSMRGSKWLVGCREANDGSMDLYASFPLTVELRDKKF